MVLHYLKRMSIYDYSVYDIEGRLVPLFRYQNQILLIVNTALHCPFSFWYEDLEKLYRKHHRNGFEILDFPCNQFHGHAPESSEEIDRICREDHQTTYPRFQKVDVIGDSRSPLFAYLQSKLKFKGFDKGNVMSKLLNTIQIKDNPGFENSNDIKWNFTMFLVDRNGKPIKRFEPTCRIEDLEKDVVRIEDKQIL